MPATAAGAARPFLRWVGGKQKLLPQLLPLLPSDLAERYYVEPFVGGGAMFFAIHDRVKSSMLADTNRALVHLYQTVRDFPDSVCTLLAELAEIHDENTYERVRNRFNGKHAHLYSAAQRAADFIYLNKTCFNGLWRVNSSGEFNVPLDKSKKASAILDRDAICVASRALESTGVVLRPFNEIVLLEMALPSRPLFVYMDPPYAPVSPSANFTSYTAERFDFRDQQTVYHTARALHEDGHRVMVSNSDVESMQDLWGRDPNFNITRVSARRNVNRDATKRGPISELVIRNYT